MSPPWAPAFRSLIDEKPIPTTDSHEKENRKRESVPSDIREGYMYEQE